MGNIKQKDLPKVSVIIPMRNEKNYIRFESCFFWAVNPVLGSYLGLSIFTSAKIGFKKGWKYSFILPIAFGAIHFSYCIDS